jgi:hypothetical protein
MPRLRGLALALLVGAVAFGGATLSALEGVEVVVLRTGAAAAARKTRTWIADEGTAALVEAANPERPFLRDLRACRADILPNPGGHERIRGLLRARYGWADWWVGLLTDTSASVAVRLDCP